MVSIIALMAGIVLGLAAMILAWVSGAMEEAGWPKDARRTGIAAGLFWAASLLAFLADRF